MSFLDMVNFDRAFVVPKIHVPMHMLARTSCPLLLHVGIRNLLPDARWSISFELCVVEAERDGDRQICERLSVSVNFKTTPHSTTASV